MIRKCLLLFLATVVALPALAQFQAPAASPKSTVTQRIGLTDVTITYSRPGVKGRTIWGDLVPYDKVWRTGANSPTVIEISRDAKVNGNDLKAGSYSIHTIPTTGAWTIIFNSAADPSGGYSYDEARDVLRFTVEPKEHHFHERFTIAVPEVDESSATVAFMWEKLEFSFRIEVDTKAHAMASAKSQLDNWVPAYQAANYAASVGEIADADRWMDRSLGLRETYWNTSAKAKMLADAGRKNEAIAMAKKAIALGKEAGNDTAPTEKLLAEWSK
jgi:hypothetical protein